jgi:hypothetical protein
VWDADGRLLEAAYADSESGALRFNISLKKVGAVEYAYKGKRGDKSVAGKFKTKGKRGLATEKIVADLVAKELLAGKSSELKTEEYHAGLNPEGPVEVSYKTASKENRLIKVKLGEMEAVTTSDDKGRAEKIEIPVGSASLTSERVLVRGSP